MRAFIHYQLQIDFPEPARGLTQVLRLQPRGFDSQYVQDWFVGVEPDARLRRSEDAFGNIVHSCSHDGPLERLTIAAEGEIETSDAAGVVAGQYEKFPLDIYLRDLDSTHADARMREFLRDSLASETDPLGRMHALMSALNDKLTFEPGETPAPRPAAEVFDAGKGSARELAQVMIAAAREVNAPARFISGFFLGGATDTRFSTGGRASEAGVAAAHHAWAEIFVDPIGWIGFDPALGYCPRDEHLRIAQGLDFYGAAPRRGASFGFAKEESVTRLTLDFARQASWQTQQ
jgi:transglutaminase-like putative cysteine protease